MTTPDILSPEFARDPYPFYRLMRDDYPLFFHEGTKSYILSRYEDVERAFKDPVFSNKNYEWQIEPVHGRTILQMDGKEHAMHRNLLTPAFRGRELQERFVPVIEKTARDLIDVFRARGSVELVDAFATRFPINVIMEMLGLPMADHHLFHAWYTSIMAFFSNLSGDQGVIARGLETRKELAEYMLPVIAERRRSPGKDLLSTLCAAEIDGVRMTDEEIRGFVSLLLTAGGETTDKAVASLVKNLVEHPEQLEAVRRDRSLIDAAFAETLRYSPPVHMILRSPLEDVTVSGGVIPAGATVNLLIGAANRDERRFAYADRFDLFRKELDVERAFTAGANHAAFALGRHFCVGAVLAKTELQIATGLLLDAMPDVRFAEGVPVESGVFTRAPKTLKLRFTPATA